MKKNGWNLKNKSKENEKNIVEENHKGVEAAEALTTNDRDVLDEWVLDSGCTFFMCPVRSWFRSLQVVEGEMVFMGNNNMCEVAGIRNVKRRVKGDRVVNLTNVRCVPRLRRNLISIGTLDGNWV